MNARSVIDGNLSRVEERIAGACARAGRRRGDVTFVAVTKSVSTEVAAILPQLGVTDIGENRPQALWAKAASLLPAVRRHLIGHLQRNKVTRTLPLVFLMHSVDSLRLLDAIETEAERLGRLADVLLEINVSREANKNGFATEELAAVTEGVGAMRHVRVRGLMTMAALSDDPTESRPTFAALRTLRERLHRDLGGTHTLEHLSMGMSGDFEVGIEEGATLIRVGSALFEGLKP